VSDPIIDDAIVNDGDTLVHDDHRVPWQKALKPVTLPGGIPSQLRSDGYAYIPKGYEGPGWYRPNVKTKNGWEKGPDAPEKFNPDATPNKNPYEMGDADIAVHILGMTPEQYINIASAPDYRPGMLQQGFDNPENFLSRHTGTIGKSLLGGLRSGTNAVAQLISKPQTWGGDSRNEMLYQALGRLNQKNQNLNQGRNVGEDGGFFTDPLYSASKFIPGAILAGPLGPEAEGASLPTAASVDTALTNTALQTTGKALVKEGVTPIVSRASALAARSTPQIAPNAAATFVTTPGSIEDRTNAAATAAVLIPATHVAGELFSPILQRVMNFVSKRPMPTGAAGQDSVAALGEHFNVPTTAADAVEDPASKIKALGKLQTGAPLGGLGELNTEQQAKAQVAALKLVDGLKQKMKDLGFQNEDFLLKAAKSGNQQAVKLVEMIKAAGDDPAKVLQADGNVNLFMAQTQVDHAFDRARGLDTGVVFAPDSPELQPMLDTAKRELKKATDVGEANENKPLTAYLRKVIKDLSGKAPDEGMEVVPNGSGDSAASQEAINRVAQENKLGRPRYIINLRTGQATPIPASVDAVDQLAMPHTAIVQKGVGKDPNAWVVLDHNSKAPQFEVDAAMPRISASLDKLEAERQAAAPKPAPTSSSDWQATYSTTADYRKGIQQKRRAVGTPGSELVGNDATAALKELQNASEESMAQMAEFSPGAAKADRYARELYKSDVLPFKNRAIINELRTLTPDKVANRLSTMSPDEVAHVTSVLGQKGKAAATLNMIDRAVKDSMDLSRPEAYRFQPLAFAAKIQNPQFQESLGLTVKGEDKWAINGFAKLMNHLQLAGQIGTPSLTFSQRMLSEPSVLTKWMLTTPRGKSLLLAASDLKVGSPSMAKVVDAIEKALPSTTAVQENTP
jgi:hypothetical protein